MELTLDMAKAIIYIAQREVQRMGNKCSIAISDENGWLVALHRMDGTPIATVDIARDKAWTAAAFKVSSSEVSKFGDASRPGFGLNPTKWNDHLTTIPGGLPIKDGDKIIGAIGVSGGKPEEDVAVGQATIAAMLTLKE